MATTIKWIDNNFIETAHRIYKSSTYFTKDNLPVPLVELGPDIAEYVDSAGVDGENWYIVSALLNDYEVFSEPFIAGLTTAYIHDVFGDGSAVATYNFDGDATDLGGNFDGTRSGTDLYTDGIISQAAEFNNGNYINIPNNIIDGRGDFSVSFWVYPIDVTGTNPRWLAFAGNNTDVQFILSTGFFSVFNEGDTYSIDPLSLNKWTHIIVTSSFGQPTIYVDSIDISISGSSGPVVGTSYSAIGGGSTYDYAIGMIDQVRIFDRILNQAEVNILYQEGAQYL